MVRRYDEPIEVTSALARAAQGRSASRPGEPEAFIWRGRLFVVRSVLSRWQERRAWWREVGTDAVGDRRTEREREVFRVEASAGRAVGTGVFDLGADGVDPSGSARWVLVRTHD